MDRLRRLAGRRWLLAAMLLAVSPLVAVAQGGSGQAVPKQIRMIYPFAAGSGGDVLARLLAERIAPALGATVIVENKTGAAGRIAVQSVVSAEPDGATLLFTSNPVIVIHPHTYAGQLGYDPFKDLKPISQVATFDVSLVVAPGVPATTPKALADWLKANPDKGGYGSPGAGGLGHFLAVSYANVTGLDIRHVPYKGSSAVMNDLVGGQISFGFVPTGDAVSQHKASRARIIATTGRARNPLVPDVPTFKDGGLAVEGEGWYAVYAPAKTPDALVETLGKAIATAARAPEIRERLLALSLVATGTTPAGLASLQAAETVSWAPAVKASGFKPQP